MITGTIYQTTKQMQLTREWEKKKEELSINKKPQRELSQEERMLKDFQERCEEEREANSHAGIYTKLESGGKLTQDEIDYLEKNDPEALSKYRQAQAEKKAYADKLRHCKTKEEVERVKVNKLNSYVAEAKRITNNPYIPKGKKLALMKELNNKLCMIEEAHEKFVNSPAYKELPKESDIQKERADETRERDKEGRENIEESVKGDEELKKAYEESENKQKLSTDKADIATETEEEKSKKVRRNEPDIEIEQRDSVKKDISFKSISTEFRQMIRGLDDGIGQRNIDISV